MAEHFRNLLVCQDITTISLLEVSLETQKRYSLQAQKCDLKFLYNALTLCNNCSLNYPKSNNKRLLVELTLIQISQISNISITQQKGAIIQQPSTTKKQEDKTVSSSTRQACLKKKEPTPLQPSQQAPQKNLGLSSFKNLLTNSGSSDNIISNEVKDNDNTSTNTQTEQKGIQTAQLRVNEININIEWTRYANALPSSESLLANRMKVVKPQQQENNNYNIIVNSEQMENLFKSALPNITKYFEKRFQESIKFNIFRPNVEDKAQVNKNLDDYTSANTLQHYIEI